jgi:hypothetical protein
LLLSGLGRYFAKHLLKEFYQLFETLVHQHWGFHLLQAAVLALPSAELVNGPLPSVKMRKDLGKQKTRRFLEKVAPGRALRLGTPRLHGSDRQPKRLFLSNG